MKYTWNNPWKSITINCPYCDASQTVYVVINDCFYCNKTFAVGVDGTVSTMTKRK